MGLRFDPVGGGQFKQAVQAIMEAERQPIKQMETRKAREEARLKLFNDFKTKFGTLDKALSEVSGFQKFRELKVDLGDGANFMTVNLDKDRAQPGSYQVQVDDLAARTSVISNGFESATDPVMGMGFVVMKTPNENVEVFVDENEASLKGIADKVNAQSASPVRAAVIQDQTDPEKPWKLVMTAKKDGKQNQIDFPDFYFLDGEKEFYIDDDKEAKNAQIQLDGFPIEAESNDIPDFLPGVNVHLKQARPDQPFTITISEDNQKIAGKLKEVVNQVNEVLKFINAQNAVDDKSDTRNTFTGDSGLQNIEYRFRNIMQEGFPVGDPQSDHFRIYHLNELGVEFDKTGNISFKEDKFSKALEKDFDAISEAITGPMGFAYQMRVTLDGYTRPGDGMLKLREKGLHDRIDAIDKQIDDKNRQLDRKQQALVKQYSRLEASLGNMQRQSQYLQATLGSSAGGGNIVQQLLGG